VLMTFVVKDVKHQTTLDIKVEVAFVTTVDEAITCALTSITDKILISIRCLREENEGVSMKWVRLFYR
jgi:hypothetical protein